MIHDDRWRRLIFHILDEMDDEDIAAERAAVHLYAAIFHRLDPPEETP